jgi:uncharacterized membrane protein
MLEVRCVALVPMTYLLPILDSALSWLGTASVFIQLWSSVTFSILLRHWIRSIGICKVKTKSLLFMWNMIYCKGYNISLNERHTEGRIKL